MSDIKIKPWWMDAIVYELYVDKFANNFKGLSNRLDYFKYLGINTLWILPHYPSPMVDGGYDITDYLGVREDLGTLSDFEEFIVKAHRNDIKVVIDLVLNHTSDKHPWFIESCSSRSNSKRGWYLWSDNNENYPQAFVHFSNIKKSNWIFNPATNDYYYATFYPQQPDLNWDNPEVYNSMIDVVDFWLSKGVDGFRLDAISRLVKRSGTNCFALPETHEIIKRLRSDINKKFPEAILMAESGGWPWEAKPFFGEGNECHLVINFPMAVNLISAIFDHDLGGIQKVLDDSSGIPNECRWGMFLTNHDTVDLFFLTDERRRKTLVEKEILPLKSEILGEFSYAARLSEICKGDKKKILWAYKELFNLPCVPLLYYGNEIGMPNVKNLPLNTDSREHVRGSFDWDEAEKQKQDQGSLLNGIKEIIENHNDTLHALTSVVSP